MSTAVATRPDMLSIERVLIAGDLSTLSPEARVAYYNRVCESLGLNPLTVPFEYLKLSGKTVLYAKRDATEQLRKLHGVSITAIATQQFQDVYIVTANAQDKTGRTDASTGVVPLGTLKGEALANALMKAETKAKRRVTLSICGLGMLDETELETLPKGGYVVEAPGVVALPMRSGSAEAAVTRVDPSAGGSGVRPSGAEVSGAAAFAPDSILTVKSVEMNPTRNPNVKKYVLVLSDGRVVTTVNERFASLAEQIAQEQCAVTVETKSTKWGEDLVALRRVKAETDPTLVTDDDDSHVPF